MINVIEPTPAEVEAYIREQEEKGEAENNDYLKYVLRLVQIEAKYRKLSIFLFLLACRDDTWGPSPDLFRYEVEELEPDDPAASQSVILEAIDVKREKAALTRDKCKILLKLAMDYDEETRKFVLKVK